MEDFTKIYGLKDYYVVVFNDDYFEYNESWHRWDEVEIDENIVPYCRKEVWAELKEIDTNLDNGLVYGRGGTYYFRYEYRDYCYYKKIKEVYLHLEEYEIISWSFSIAEEYPEEIHKYLSLPPK